MCLETLELMISYTLSKSSSHKLNMNFPDIVASSSGDFNQYIVQNQKYFNTQSKQAIQQFQQFPLPIQYCMIANVIVYLLWKISSEEFMTKNFTRDNSKKKKWWTTITSHFSHPTIFDLLSNMYIFSIIGPSVYNGLGEKGFLEFLLCTVIGSSFILDRFEDMMTVIRPKDSLQDFIAKPTYNFGFSSINAAFLVIYTTLSRANIQINIPFIGTFINTPTQFLQKCILFDIIGLIIKSTFFPNLSIPFAKHLSGYMSGCIHYVIFLGSRIKSLGDGINKIGQLLGLRPKKRFPLFR